MDQRRQSSSQVSNRDAIDTIRSGSFEIETLGKKNIEANPRK
jgi:hypothetical protein